MATVDLRLDEANELLSAWTHAVARARGIRALLIKGRTLSDYGLRPPRVSADVDLLVEPGRFDEYCGAVLAAGWEEFPGTFASEHFTLHSRSFRKQGWPNSLDVHAYYPGFLHDPADVFDLLWDRRAPGSFAHVTCDVPDRVASLFILLLHSLRGTDQQPRHASELAHALSVSLTEAERADAAALATATGAAAALRDVLPQLGITASVPSADLASPAYREWRRKVSGAQGAAGLWLHEVRRTPWLQKPGIVWRALWPSREDFAINHPEIPSAWWPQVRGRLARLRRGFSRAPRVLRESRR